MSKFLWMKANAAANNAKVQLAMTASFLKQVKASPSYTLFYGEMPIQYRVGLDGRLQKVIDSLIILQETLLDCPHTKGSNCPIFDGFINTDFEDYFSDWQLNRQILNNAEDIDELQSTLDHLSIIIVNEINK